MPNITVPVTIDGTTQPGYAGVPLIDLNGYSAGSGASGLDLQAGSSTVKGLVINQFNFDGLHHQFGQHDRRATDRRRPMCSRATRARASVIGSGSQPATWWQAI